MINNVGTIDVQKMQKVTFFSKLFFVNSQYLSLFIFYILLYIFIRYYILFWMDF